MMEHPICAVATVMGRSAVGVIRLSGENTLKLLTSIFYKASSKRDGKITSEWLASQARRALFGKIIDPQMPEAPLDEVLLIPFVTPHSYTGEEAAEIHAHGNPLVLEKIIELLLHVGFEPARPGEFTRRAFLNGKLDLSQAEAVHEIISARGEKELQKAQLMKAGAFRTKILQFRSDLLNLTADLTAELDFGEEDIQFASQEQKLSVVREALDELETLAEDSRNMEIFREGLDVVIAGAPNAGKSSLLNYLIGKDRALVSDTPGTTRDYLEARMHIGGVPVKYIDTAGIRSETSSETELAGIQKSFEKLKEADLVLYLLDSSLGENELDLSALSALAGKTSAKVLILLNKFDIADSRWGSSSQKSRVEISSLKKYLNDLLSDQELLQNAIAVSAKTGEGIKHLQKRVDELIEEMSPHSSLVVSAWQREIIETIIQRLNTCYEMIENNESPELVVQSLQDALDRFSELTGEITTEDILGRIFSRFCIGK